jgi:type I restriction enzyme R subunit
VEGVSVEFRRADNSIGADIIKVIDYENPENNDFLAINQFTVVEDRHERRRILLYSLTAAACSI